MSPLYVQTLLIANRGAIACRILRTLRAMQMKGVAVYSDADLSSLHIREADEAIGLGDGPAAQTYGDGKIIAAALKAGPKLFIPATVSYRKTLPSPRLVKLPGWRLSARLPLSYARLA